MQRAVAGDQKVVARGEVDDQFGMLEHPADALTATDAADMVESMVSASRTRPVSAA